MLSGVFNVLCVGPLANEEGVWLLADAFLAARRSDERVHLTLAGVGPEEEALRARLGDGATFLAVPDDRAYASADVFFCASRTDTSGQAMIEAQASGVPVLAVDDGLAASLIEHGRTGLLVPADTEALSAALLMLAHRPPLRTQLSRGALAAHALARAAA